MRSGIPFFLASFAVAACHPATAGTGSTGTGRDGGLLAGGRAASSSGGVAASSGTVANGSSGGSEGGSSTGAVSGTTGGSASGSKGGSSGGSSTGAVSGTTGGSTSGSEGGSSGGSSTGAVSGTTGGSSSGSEAGSSGGSSTGAVSGTTGGSTSGSEGGSSGGSSTGAVSGTTGGAVGGSSSGSGGPRCPAAASALALSPASPSIRLDGSQPAPLAFSVTATTPGGAEPVDPSLLIWTATRDDDTNPGTVADGVFTPYAGAGGVVTVTAAGCGATGTAAVDLVLDETLSTDGGAPGDFGDGGVPGSPDAPEIVYPSGQTRFPRNVYRVLFQWKANGSRQFRLRFTGSQGALTVFTDGRDPACASLTNAGCWQADPVTWDAIAGSNAGGTVQLAIDGTAGAGATVYLGDSETLGFSRRDVLGAIFYWAANRGGIERATVSDQAPQDYLVGGSPGVTGTQVDGYTVQCAACHTVSRDGRKLAASIRAQGPTNAHGAWVMEVTANPPPLPLVTDVPAAAGDGYSAFSPDTTKLVWGPRNGGTLQLIDALTGATITPIEAGGEPVQGSAVDWSPDGGLIAFANTRGGISTVAFDPAGGGFSPVESIAGAAGPGGPGGPPGPAGAAGFPMFDPEGDEIAYSNQTDLWLVPPAGGTPVGLAAANTIVNNAVAPPKENSMPTWAPGGDLHWLAFNSSRPYGLLTPGGRNQIWVAALDFSRLPADPSYPAFWLPFQKLGDLNHRAFWALDMRTQLPDGGLIPDAGPGDAGTAVDAGGPACTPLGGGCDLVSSYCCDPELLGNYCGSVGDGGTACLALPN